MEDPEFAALAARLEQTATEQPRRYLLTVLGVAALGFAILGLVVGMALLNVALIALLVFAVVATGGKALVFFAKLGKLLFVLAVPAWLMIKATVTLLFARFPRPEGRDLGRDEAPALFARLDEMRARLKGPKVHRVILTDELNAAIAQHPRLGLFGFEENTLILGFPFLQAMSEAEALAVVAHEYGHLSGHHSRLGGFIYRFRSAWGRLQELSGQWNDWGSRLIARLFRWYAPRFNAYTFALARQNEYVADRTSVELVGAGPAASALLRASIAGRFEDEHFWPAINQRVAAEAEPPAQRSAFWADSLRQTLDAPQRVRFLESSLARATDPLDTHPALADRLAAIGARADADAAERLEAPERSAAEAWLGESLPAIGREFDQAWQTRVAAQWHARHEELAGYATRLAELDGAAELDADAQWERIRLLDELDDPRDQRPLVEALLAAEPEHLSALYRRGALRLGDGDAGGIDDIERVMAADADAVLVGCEAIWRFLLERDEARAESYRQRWLERNDHLERVRAESETLTPDATLVAAEVDADTLAQVGELLRAHGRHIRRAWLLRRVFRSDPALADHVLAFETRWYLPTGRAEALVKGLAALEWPLSLFIVHLGGRAFRPFRKTIRKLALPPLDY